MNFLSVEGLHFRMTKGLKFALCNDFPDIKLACSLQLNFLVAETCICQIILGMIVLLCAVFVVIRHWVGQCYGINICVVPQVCMWKLQPSMWLTIFGNGISKTVIKVNWSLQDKALRAGLVFPYKEQINRWIVLAWCLVSWRVMDKCLFISHIVLAIDWRNNSIQAQFHESIYWLGLLAICRPEVPYLSVVTLK